MEANISRADTEAEPVSSNGPSQRAYKACNVCRKRKSRCMLPPDGDRCHRCQREGKACVFPDHRYQRRSHGRRYSEQRSGESSLPDAAPTNMSASQVGISPAGPSPATSGLADSVMRTVVSSGNDARDLLFSVVRDDGEANDTGIYPPQSSPQLTMSNRPNTLAAVEVWNACRWVMQGWLSAEEAILLVDFFFETISPLSPILTKAFYTHGAHYSLVTDEPFLSCVILAIAARYMSLPGAGGQIRSNYLHDRLWTHIQHLLLRLMLGQEKQSKGKTRTLGTIEALLLLTEWQPRALAFPPPVDGWDSGLLLHADETGAKLPKTAAERVRGRWAENVVRPARRFDQMSWMMLGNAMTLACELGVFDGPARQTDMFDPTLALNERAQRLRQLLYVYSEQTSLQLGCRSILPHGVQHLVLDSKNRNGVHDDSPDRRILAAWKELTTLSRSIVDALFQPATGAQSSQLIGRHSTLIDHFIRSLGQWEDRFLETTSDNDIPQAHQHLLRMEYLGIKVHICSIGMQAALSRRNSQGEILEPLDVAGSYTHSSEDHQHIQAVIDGSIEVLQVAIELSEQQTLRYTPNRTIQRIVSASVFLLKAISLSVSSAKLTRALSVMTQTIAALRQSAVDDIQLSSRYAELLQMCLDGLQEKFVSYGQTSLQSHLSNGPGATAAPQDIAGLQNDQPVGDAPNSMTFTNDWEADWLRLPVDPTSLLAGDPTDTYGFSWFNDHSLDFLWDLNATGDAQI